MRTFPGLRALSIRAASAAFLCSVAGLSGAQSGYRIGEDSSSADAGPVRMARFDYLSGKVDFRPTSSLGWSAATRNLPIRQGAQVWAPNSSKAEVQFDDGSDMRLAAGAVATLVTMYSDSHGEFTEIKLSDGLATLHLTNKDSLYQIDTPNASIKAYGPAEIRIGDTSGIEIAVQKGKADMQGINGKFTLTSGQYLNLPNKNCPCTVKRVPAADPWDKFNDDRDQVVYQHPKYVPQNIGLVAGGLDTYGDWHDDRTYGHVWVPREHGDWRPYHDGRWVWNDPYGWTWVGNEDWGWAPYHYGTWVHEDYGWGWCPGPERQCWSPAVVSYSSYDGNVAWCPLGPREVHYPAAFGLSFGVGSLLLSFSIGRAGCYYPAGDGYCEPRPWSNVYVNRITNVYDIHHINNYYGDPGFSRAWGRNNFVPGNARFGGGTFVAATSFAGTGAFRNLPPAQAAVFQRGQSFGMPRGQAGQVAGPFNVRPVAASFTASRTYSPAGPSTQILNRQVYRSGVPTYAARNSVGVGTAVSRTPNLARGAAIGAGAVGAAVLAHGAASHFANRAHSTTAPVQHGANGFANRTNRTGTPGRSSFTRAGGFATNRATAVRARNTAQTHVARSSSTPRVSHRTGIVSGARAVSHRATNVVHRATQRVRSAAHRVVQRAFQRNTQSSARPTRSYSRPASSRPAQRINRSASAPSFRRSQPRQNNSFRSSPPRSFRESPRPSGPSRSSFGGGGNRPAPSRPSQSRPASGRPSGGGGGGDRRHGH